MFLSLTMAAALLGQAPVIITRTTDVSYEHRPNLAHPSTRAIAERKQTLEARRDWLKRRHIVLAELEAKRALEEAPAPRPMPQGPSTGPSAMVNNYIVIGGGMPQQGMPQQFGIPPTAGRVPDMYWAAYWPFIRRMDP